MWSMTTFVIGAQATLMTVTAAAKDSGPPSGTVLVNMIPSI